MQKGKLTLLFLGILLAFAFTPLVEACAQNPCLLFDEQEFDTVIAPRIATSGSEMQWAYNQLVTDINISLNPGQDKNVQEVAFRCYKEYRDNPSNFGASGFPAVCNIAKTGLIGQANLLPLTTHEIHRAEQTTRVALTYDFIAGIPGLLSQNEKQTIMDKFKRLVDNSCCSGGVNAYPLKNSVNTLGGLLSNPYSDSYYGSMDNKAMITHSTLVLLGILFSNDPLALNSQYAPNQQTAIDTLIDENTDQLRRGNEDLFDPDGRGETYNYIVYGGQNMNYWALLASSKYHGGTGNYDIYNLMGNLLYSPVWLAHSVLGDDNLFPLDGDNRPTDKTSRVSTTNYALLGHLWDKAVAENDQTMQNEVRFAMKRMSQIKGWYANWQSSSYAEVYHRISPEIAIILWYPTQISNWNQDPDTYLETGRLFRDNKNTAQTTNCGNANCNRREAFATMGDGGQILTHNKFTGNNVVSYWQVAPDEHRNHEVHGIAGDFGIAVDNKRVITGVGRPGPYSGFTGISHVGHNTLYASGQGGNTGNYYVPPGPEGNRESYVLARVFSGNPGDYFRTSHDKAWQRSSWRSVAFIKKPHPYFVHVDDAIGSSATYKQAFNTLASMSASGRDFTINNGGKQVKGHYHYPDSGLSFNTPSASPGYSIYFNLSHNEVSKSMSDPRFFLTMRAGSSLTNPTGQGDIPVANGHGGYIQWPAGSGYSNSFTDRYFIKLPTASASMTASNPQINVDGQFLWYREVNPITEVIIGEASSVVIGDSQNPTFVYTSNNGDYNLAYDDNKLTITPVVFSSQAGSAASVPDISITALQGLNTGFEVYYDDLQGRDGPQVVAHTISSGMVVIGQTGPTAQCGNSVCEATEDCGSCINDCPCPSGQACNVNQCVAAQTFYGDHDGDSYGDPSVSVQAATQPQGHVNNNEDCNDNNAQINPGATEICYDLIDNDCDDLVDGFDSSDCPSLPGSQVEVNIDPTNPQVLQTVDITISGLDPGQRVIGFYAGDGNVRSQAYPFIGPTGPSIINVMTQLLDPPIHFLDHTAGPQGQITTSGRALYFGPQQRIGIISYDPHDSDIPIAHDEFEFSVSGAATGRGLSTEGYMGAAGTSFLLLIILLLVIHGQHKRK